MNRRESSADGAATLRLALFASFLSILVAAAMLLLRAGLPTPLASLATGPAIAGLAMLGPALWANRRGSARAELWVGPLGVLALFAGCLVAALGVSGQVLLCAGFLTTLVGAILALRRPGTPPGGGLALWTLLLLLALVLAVLLLDGSKYVNFIADQLLLYGRTDGDVMFHGAIANAIRNFGMPSTGIDGVHLLRYHTLADALTALIAGGGASAVMALVILQNAILVPLAVFGIAWAGQAFAGRFLPALPVRPLGLALAAVVMALLMQSGSIGNLVIANTPMLLSGVLLILLAPAVAIELIERRTEATLALYAAVISLPVLSLAKISTGLIWGGLAGWLVLRVIGPKRAAFWIVGVVMLALFGGCYWLGNDPGQSGAVLFGTPFYVETIRNGNLLVPLTVHLYLLIVLAALFRLRKSAPPQQRLLVEAMLAVTATANLPTLVLEIPGGDSFFFLSAMNWLFAPLVAMLLAALPAGLRIAQPGARRLVLALVAVGLVAALVDGGLKVEDRVSTAISGAALLHTGDLSYHTDDKRKVWRADTRRALAEHGLLGLYRLPPPVPAGAGLAAALKAAQNADSRTAAYIPPQSDYWSFVKDCDGRSLWPMAAAGVPLIDGYVPVQAECRQEFSLIGYGTPPEVRTPLPEPELCRRAVEAGFPVVLQVESLADRSKDHLTTCR